MSQITSHLSTALADRQRIELDGERARASTGEHGDESRCHVILQLQLSYFVGRNRQLERQLKQRRKVFSETRIMIMARRTDSWIKSGDGKVLRSGSRTTIP